MKVVLSEARLAQRRAAQARYTEAHPGRVKANKLRCKEKNLERYKELKAACDKRHYQLNKEKILLVNKKWAENNPEKTKQIQAEHKKRYRAHYVQYNSIKRLRLKQAQPLWSSKEDLLDVYKEAQCFGLEVDHIIPLTHKLVCGLHVWDNLQLLSRSENAQKSNQFIIRED